MLFYFKRFRYRFQDQRIKEITNLREDAIKSRAETVPNHRKKKKENVEGQENIGKILMEKRISKKVNGQVPRFAIYGNFPQGETPLCWTSSSATLERSVQDKPTDTHVDPAKFSFAPKSLLNFSYSLSI